MSDVEKLKARLEAFAGALIKAAATIEKSRTDIDRLLGQGPEIVAATYRGIGETLQRALTRPLDGLDKLVGVNDD